jgi:hypothetical protein
MQVYAGLCGFMSMQVYAGSHFVLLSRAGWYPPHLYFSLPALCLFTEWSPIVWAAMVLAASWNSTIHTTPWQHF